MNPTRLHAIMSGDARDIRAKLARLAMSCAEPFYRGAVALRNAMFDWGIRKPKKLPRPVISIGNITTGGTGKTPMVIELARRLLAMGAKPGILTRGYKGRRDGDVHTSDEVAVFHSELGDTVPVEANPDRAAGAEAMTRRVPEVDVFLLDDGFQHRQVRRDLDIALIDATAPFGPGTTVWGHGRMLPRGMLREPFKNLRRANVIVVTRANQILAADLEGFLDIVLPQEEAGIGRACYLDDPSVLILQQGVRGKQSSIQLLRANMNWDRIVQQDKAGVPIERLCEIPIFMFTGIGNPSAFEVMLKRHAPDVRSTRIFTDHHEYTTGDVQDILRDAQASGARAIITTEKDWVKVAPLLDWTNSPLPVFRPALRVEFPNEKEWRPIEERIRACLKRP